MLANVLLRYEIIDRGLKEGNVNETLEEISTIKEMVRVSLREVRRMIYDLRPMALDDLGLIPTLEKRSEEHTSELQSRGQLVCRLLLEIKKRQSHRNPVICR